MDMTEIIIVSIAIVGFCALAFLAGKFQDILWRTKTYRKYLKRNFTIIERVSKDGKTRIQRMADMDNDVFSVGMFMWLIKKGRIYRKDKEECGFTPVRANISWEEGVPIITVDEDSIKPLDFYKEESTIRPEELGSTLNAWVMNQLAKGFAAIKNQDLWIKLIAVGVLINLLMTFTVMDGVGKLQAAFITPGSDGGTVNPQGGTATHTNDSIVIKQSGVK